MWKLVFNTETNRGSGFNRSAGEGEYEVMLPPSQCAHFAETPERYQYVDGVFGEFAGWTEEVSVKALAKALHDQWEAIKAERTRRMEGGFKIEVRPDEFKWYHSDAPSRTQHLALVMAGSDVPAIPWKTMDGTFEPMSQEIAGKIFQAAFNLDGTLFAVAEQHRAAMEASADPEAYDFSTGWPEYFSAV